MSPIILLKIKVRDATLQLLLIQLSQRCVQYGKSLRSATRGGARVILNTQFAANVFNMATMAKLKLNFLPITANAG